MSSISLVMIVKNEERVLGRCLDSICDLVDEIVIVDTGSEDQTVEIAGKYTKHIYSYEWTNDFAAARNFAFQKAGKEYTMWLDADDIIFPEDREKFLHIKESLSHKPDSVLMPYVLGRNPYGQITSSLKRNRLVKTSRGFQWKGAVHEYLEVHGTIIEVDICITHLSVKSKKTDRNLKIYEQLEQQQKQLSPRDLYYFGNECFEHGLLEKCLKLYREFLDTNAGWQEDCIAAIDRAAEALLQLGRTEEAEELLFESFKYDIPRANISCKLGYIYFSKSLYHQAIYWYKAAAECDLERVKETGALVNYAYYTWLPHIQLCVCYDKIGKKELAYCHNEMARFYNPTNNLVLQNKQYFEKIIT